jgi:hypothetical protein
MGTRQEFNIETFSIKAEPLKMGMSLVKRLSPPSQENDKKNYPQPFL